MKKYKQAKKILKNDTLGLSFVTRTNRKEIEKDIQDCLEKQQDEIDDAVDSLYKAIKLNFETIADFKIFIVNNSSLNTSMQ